MAETINDIVRKIHERAEVAACQDGDATVHHSAVAAMLRELADRTEKAAEHDYQALGEQCKRLEDAYEKQRQINKDLVEENESLKKCVLGKCARTEVDAELCTDCPWAEIERLKAQLKAVGDYAAQTYDLKEALRCIARSARAALKEEDV